MSEDLRYVSGLQDAADKSCYKDFFESNKLEEAKQQADECAETRQRSTIVFDRKDNGIIYKKEIKRDGDKEVKTVVIEKRNKSVKKSQLIQEELPPVVKRGKGRPPKNKPMEIKTSSKDDYF